MRKVLLLSAAAVLVSAAPSRSSAQVLLSPAVKQDVQCFVLYAIGIDMAKSDKDRQGAMMAMMYFVGKLTVGAPNVDLVKAIRQEGEALQRNPNAKEIGAACDDEVEKRGAELIDLGQQLQGLAGQSSPTSS